MGNFRAERCARPRVDQVAEVLHGRQQRKARADLQLRAVGRLGERQRPVGDPAVDLVQMARQGAELALALGRVRPVQALLDAAEQRHRRADDRRGRWQLPALRVRGHGAGVLEEGRPQHVADELLEHLVAPALGLEHAVALLTRLGQQRRIGHALLQAGEDRARALHLLAVLEAQARDGPGAEQRLHDERLGPDGDLDRGEGHALELERPADRDARVRSVDHPEPGGHGRGTVYAEGGWRCGFRYPRNRLVRRPAAVRPTDPDFPLNTKG